MSLEPYIHRFGRLQALALRGCSSLAVRSGMLPRIRPAWCAAGGWNLLVRWSGELSPIPDFDPASPRRLEVAGGAPPGAAELSTYADLAHAADTVYHYALLALGGGGFFEPVNPYEIETRVTDGSGAIRPHLPNAPTLPSARLLSGNRPLLSWRYSAYREQVAPLRFDVFVATPSVAFNFSAAPAATVFYSAGRSAYHWLGSALAVGDRRWYAVRAVSAAGGASLISSIGGPSPTYNAVVPARCPLIDVPVLPPRVENIVLDIEVLP